MKQQTYCGYIALVGRPNVGKSTLLNRLTGRKLSIVSKKSQTTRHRVLGVSTDGNYQLIFVDTPGWHQHPHHKMNQLMMKTVKHALDDVDVIVFVVNKHHWTDEDEFILRQLGYIQDRPILVAINKMDHIKSKKQRDQIVATIQQRLRDYAIEARAIIPISAKQKQGIEILQQYFYDGLPASPHLFPAEQISERDQRFWASEMIREKLLRLLGEEVPHSTTVEIEQFKQETKVLRISALIWVARRGQKAIVIGDQGKVLKHIGYLARKEMEYEFQQKVFLQLWVKVKPDWPDDIKALKQFGY